MHTDATKNSMNCCCGLIYNSCVCEVVSMNTLFAVVAIVVTGVDLYMCVNMCVWNVWCNCGSSHLGVSRIAISCEF